MAIPGRIADHPEVVHIFTRADSERANVVLDELPDAFHNPVARMLMWPGTSPSQRASWWS